MTGCWYRAPILLPNTRPKLRLAGLLSDICLVVFLLVILSSAPALAVDSESSEVRALIDKGLKYLETHTDERLGGRCLVALAFLKNGASLNHPRIQEAVTACQAVETEQIRGDSVYSNGLAIIFLAELDPVKYHDLIQRYAGVMAERQKDNGGWGYDAYNSGDTSQTQYAVLSYWQLLQVGIAPTVESVESGINWLLRTQDPGGGWGYQGIDPGNFQRQPQERTSLSMLSAGLGSTLICANVLGTLQPGDTAEDDATNEEKKADVPAALQLANKSRVKRIRTLAGGNLDREQVLKAVADGQKQFDKTFLEFANAEYPFYVLYSIERYKSFEEYLSGNVEENPEWYQKGFEFARARQAPEGQWNCPSGEPCATAFTILFLSRSTQKSIRAKLGEGTLVGGRGLSANLARMKLHGGRLVTERTPTEVDEMLAKLEGQDNAALDALLSNSVAIDVKNVGPEEARRLKQLVKNGNPDARLLAVEALSKLRDLDYVPALLYALTDPDKRVVRTARDGLKFVSRRFEGYGPPDNFSETERYDALEKWKNWYRRVRPDAPALP